MTVARGTTTRLTAMLPTALRHQGSMTRAYAKSEVHVREKNT
jgi:hypothetical protein